MGQSSEPIVVLAVNEGTYGIDGAPTAAANAILTMEDPQFTHEVLQVMRGNARSYFGRDQKLVYGKKLAFNMKVEIAGSGAAGTAPPVAPLLKSCALKQTLLAAPVTGTQAAGSATGGTLAAGASAVDNFYQFNEIRITGGAGVGQSGIIKSYVGATKVYAVFGGWTTPTDATSVYSIGAQVNYSPVSHPTVIPGSTIYFYHSGKIHKMLGSRGSLKTLRDSGAKPYDDFTFMGLYGGIVDSGAFPAQTLTAFQTPLVVNNANSGGVSVHGYAGKLYSLAIDLANAVAYRNVVGIEDILLTDREPALDITIEDPLIAEKDFPTLINNNTLGPVSFTHGAVAGNIVRDDCPSVQLMDPKYGNKDKEVTLSMKGELNATYGSGNDEYIRTYK